MNTVLWVLQVLLALVFLIAGIRKLIRSDEQIRHEPWVGDMAVSTVRAIGWLEILGALGVILPTLTGILPWLAPLAAIGLIGLMLGAAWANYRASLYRPIVANLIILAVAAFTAYGRYVFAAA